MSVSTSKGFEEYQTIEMNLVHPLASAILAGYIDFMYLNSGSKMNSAYFGGAVGAGILVAGVAGDFIPNNSFNLPILGNGKGLEQRIIELTLASGGAYAVNKYILKNDLNTSSMMTKLGVIVAADIGGCWVADFLSGKPLTIL